MVLTESSQGILTAVVIVFVIVFTYAYYYDHVQEKKIKKEIDQAKIKKCQGGLNSYKKFTNELSNDLDKYNINQENQDKIELVVSHILDKRAKEKSLFRRLINSGKTGVMLGSISGAITGGLPGAITAGVVFGLVNPIVIILNEFVFIPEEIRTIKKNKNALKNLPTN
jgi:uncharacterized membrane protein